jgi:hypothetical protein
MNGDPETTPPEPDYPGPQPEPPVPRPPDYPVPKPGDLPDYPVPEPEKPPPEPDEPWLQTTPFRVIRVPLTTGAGRHKKAAPGFPQPPIQSRSESEIGG